MAFSFRSLFGMRRHPPVTTVHPVLGPMTFCPEYREWETTAEGPVFHGGIPGDVGGPDPDRVAEVLSRLANIEVYWQACANDLLEIASWYDSLPRTQDPRSLFHVTALSLYPTYWEVCFVTAPPHMWLYVGMQFEGEELVSNTIDT